MQTITCAHCKGEGSTNMDCCIEGGTGFLIPPGPIRETLKTERACCACGGRGYFVLEGEWKTQDINLIMHGEDELKVGTANGVIELFLYKYVEWEGGEKQKKHVGQLYIFPDGTSKVVWL